MKEAQWPWNYCRCPSARPNSVDYNETWFVLEKILSVLLSPSSSEVLNHSFEELIPYFLIFYFWHRNPLQRSWAMQLVNLWGVYPPENPRILFFLSNQRNHLTLHISCKYTPECRPFWNGGLVKFLSIKTKDHLTWTLSFLDAKLSFL